MSRPQETQNYRYEVRTINPEAITTQAIADNPRVALPGDVEAATKNLVIKQTGQGAPAKVTALVHCLITQFFIQSHRTGLYNRQPSLWASIAKAGSAEATQLSTGIFQKKLLPVYDLTIFDLRGRPVILARLVCEAQAPQDNFYANILSGLLQKAKQTPGLNGLFLVCPEPFPQNILAKVAKLTSSHDPVGRYESRLPEPSQAHLNLLEMTSSAGAEGEEQDKVSLRLVHPNLATTRTTRDFVMESSKP
jgi:hypothetical protein